MGYYADNLSGERLRECYAIAPPRVKQYLEAEIRFVVERVRSGDRVLELGCGYGRVTFRIAEVAGRVVGVDTSRESLELARELTGTGRSCEFLEMDAADLSLPDSAFDITVCVQNGICAFGVDQGSLLREAIRVTRTGGRVMFSSYSDHFWPHRLEWFEIQAANGLLGDIDYEESRDGVIVCSDGFRAGAMRPADFEALCREVGVTPVITEVDGSSVFCEISVPHE
jgi:2-polyprenyl-6-hydroxyphenyl methylase/3-demethylubiquinone-9 3-methyltransferase